MHSPVGGFIQVLEEDIMHWEEAATACEAIVPYLVGEAQREEWSNRAKVYRDRAKAHKVLIDRFRKENG